MKINKRRAVGRKSRAQKAEENQSALFNAAAEIVGEFGYSGASISRIAERANLAQGTFYNYFESRQDVFNQLLPRIGIQMMDFVREQARHGRSFVEKEELSFRAFFAFLRKVPYFLRILDEAEIYAPEAFKQHLKNVSAGYLRFMQRSRDRGEIAALSNDELEAIVYMLMAARGYLGLRYLAPSMKRDIPEYVVSGYLQLVVSGLRPTNPVRRRGTKTPSRRVATGGRGCVL